MSFRNSTHSKSQEPYKFSESHSVCLYMLIVDMVTYRVSYFKSNDRLLGFFRSSDRSLVEVDISIG